MRARLTLVLLAACGASGPREVQGPAGGPPPAPLPRGAFVVAEHAESGGHLVLIDESGRRVRDLTDAPLAGRVDAMPAFSADGRWVAFASSRDRGSPRETSLWIVAADGSSAPRRLTGDEAIDITPAFAPGGRALAFGSTRAGELDVWTLELVPDGDRPPRAGPLRRITHTPLAEYQPAWSHAGDLIAYTARAHGGASEVMLVRADGSGVRRLTAGSGPAFAPDDRALALTAPAPGRQDADLWLIAADGSDRHRLADDVIADESAPRFTSDGRFVVATALVRAGGRALVSTVVCVEIGDPHHVLRALQAPIPTSRLGVDPVPVPPDAAKLRANPVYTEALRQALIR